MKNHRSDSEFYVVGILLAFILVLTILTESYTQVPDKAQTLAYLNKLGGDSIQFSLKGTQLNVSMYSVEKKLLREDHVQLADMDTVASFEKSSQLVCLSCLSVSPACVTRELIVQKVRRNYSRTSITSDDLHAEGYISALEHLVKIVSVKKYHDEVILPVY